MSTSSGTRTGGTLREWFASGADGVDRTCHELRRPIAVISAYTELLADDASTLDAEQRAHLTIVRRNVQRLNRLIEDLFQVFHTVTDGEDVRPMRRDLEDLCLRLAEQLEESFTRRGVKLSMTTTGPLFHPAVDETRLETALTRVLEHALRNSPRGGEVLFRMKAGDAAVRFEIRDAGPCLSKDEIEHVFDYLFRPERARLADDPGGADLSVCRALLESLGGRAWAERRGREGPTYVLELPLPGSS